MRAKLVQLLFALRHNYWFIPTVLAVVAVLVAWAATAVDLNFGTQIKSTLQPMSWIWMSEAAGARAILSTVAGSTITVAGVVFSMTILSVSHATANYGSRLLLKFLEDRRNQFTLGVFTATFLYCLIILRTISGSDSGGNVFVPQISVLVALVLAFLCVFVLIAFIHHVPNSIYIGRLIAERGEALHKALDKMFAHSVDRGAENDASWPESTAQPIGISSSATGYIQALDVNALVSIACEEFLQIKVLRRPGEFVFTGSNLLDIWPQKELDDRLEGVAERLRSQFAIGSLRTPSQDPWFQIEELQQIAARALSPGINDPFTAKTSLDWLVNAATAVVNRDSPPDLYYDDENSPRVNLSKPDFEYLLRSIFKPLENDIASSILTCCHCADLLKQLKAQCRDEASELFVERQADQLLQLALASCSNELQKSELQAAFKGV